MAVLSCPQLESEITTCPVQKESRQTQSLPYVCFVGVRSNINKLHNTKLLGLTLNILGNSRNILPYRNHYSFIQ